MSQNTESESASESEQDYPELAIEGELPLKAVGIENLKEANPKHMPPHRYIHPWFARRPTPAARLSVLGSVMPEGTTPDEMLSLMQIGPDGMESGISEYVEKKKATENQRNGTLGDWYGYPRPFTQSPTRDELDSLHNTLQETWDGELPRVLDATAGGGVIPFESIRYGIPTVANELNPVASLILKVMLEYAPEVGSLEEELYHWRDKILKTTKENLSEYYPTKENEREILASACTYNISCDSCGGTVPLVPNWWLSKNRGDAAIRPTFEDGDVSYEAVILPDGQTSDGFNPSDGIVTRSDAECPHCGVITEYEETREKISNGEFEYKVYGVKYDDPRGGSGYRAGEQIDQKGIEAAKQRIESDFELLTFLSEPVEVSSRMTDPSTYGMEEWRDIFTPRQLVAHYELLQAFESYKEDIKQEYDDDTAEAILTLLTICSSKFVDRNSRLSAWATGKGYSNPLFVGRNYSFCRIFTDNNPCADNMGYADVSRKVIDSYESLVEMVDESNPAKVHNLDAGRITERIGSDAIEAAVVDPPYYDSVMYAQLSDVFYVLQKEYLSDIHPKFYDSELTNKEDEAVADPSRFEGISGDQSKKQMAKDEYENKMSNIFGELYDAVKPGGVLTIMFTHKETDAWDTLSMSLINAGFTITATHPITSEMPSRAAVRGANSADSTILLTGRKPTTESDEDGSTTLWEQVKKETQREAKKAARELLDSGLSLTRTDTIIAAFGPTLKVFSDNYPVVDKKGNRVPPRDALAEARDAVVQVFADRDLATSKFDNLDSLTRWYILSWLTYETDTFPYDEGLQLGMGLGVDIDEVKQETKIWGKRSGDIQLKGHSDRVQDIVRLEAGEDVSQRKYPVDPTKERFSRAIDAVHSAVHIYENKGSEAAWDWLTERNLKNDQRFETAVKALLEVLPAKDDTAKTLLDMVSGKTGDYLDIDISTLNLNVEQDDEGPEQTGINDFE